MRINDPQVKLILEEETRLFVINQHLLTEHKRLVNEKKDFHSQAVLFLLEDLTGKPIDPELLDESLWEKGKHLMSKLGGVGSHRRKGFSIGGKKRFAGKKYKAAVQKIEAALEKASSQKVKDLRAKIKKEVPEFPNNEKHEEFVDTLYVIAQVYDSIKAESKEAGDLGTIKQNNIVIAALRDLVKFYMDNELSTSFTTLTEEQRQWLEEAKVGSTAARGGTAVGRMSPEETGDDSAELFKGGYTKSGTHGTERWKGAAGDSETSKMLHDKLLPALLVGGGGLAALLAAAPWFIELIQGVAQNPTPSTVRAVTEKITNTLTFDRKTPGVTQALGGFLHGDAGHFGPNTPMSEILGALEKVGIDSQSPGNLFADATNPSAMASSWASQIAAMGSNTAMPAGEFFGREGTALARSFWMEPGTVVSKITTKLAKVGARKAAKTAGAGGLAAVLGASWLAPLGIALATAGGAMMLLRRKGRKSSRAALLADLVNEMTPTPEPDAPDQEPAPGPDQEPDQEPETPTPGKKPARDKVSYDIYTAGEKLGRGKGEALNSVLTSAEIERKYKDIIARHIRDQIEARGINVNEAKINEREYEPGRDNQPHRGVGPKITPVSPERAAADAANAEEELTTLFGPAKGAEGEAEAAEELVLDTAEMIKDLKAAGADAAMITKILDATEAWAKTQPNPTKINRPDAEPGEGGEGEGEGDPGEGEGEPGEGEGEPTAPPLGGLSQGQMISLLNSTGLRWEEVGGKIDAWMKNQASGPLGLSGKDLKRAEIFRDELRKVWATFEGDDIKEAVQKLNISRSTWAMIPGFVSYLKEQSRLNESKSFNRWKLLANIK